MRTIQCVLAASCLLAISCASPPPHVPTPDGDAELRAEHERMAAALEQQRAEREQLDAARAELERRVDEERARATMAAQQKARALQQADEAARKLETTRHEAAGLASRVQSLKDSLAELEAAVAAKQDQIAALDTRAQGTAGDLLTGLTSVRDPTDDTIRYLRTSTDVYLGRFHLGGPRPLEVEEGAQASGKVTFYPFPNSFPRSALSSGASQQALLFDLQLQGSSEPTPLGKGPIPLSRLLLSGDEYPIGWYVDTPRRFGKTEVLVRARLVDDPQAPDVLDADIPLVGKSWLQARIDDLGLVFAGLTGLLGVVGGFVLSALGLFQKIRSAIGGGG